MKGLKIVIAGGTGFVGTQMAARWAADNEVVILTRNMEHRADNSYGQKNAICVARLVAWDARTLGAWTEELEGCDLLVNLAGRTVNCRYNEKNKAEIMNSRIDANKVLGEAVKVLGRPPALWVNSASATIYRHAEDRPQDEVTGEIENDFSVQVCKAWEKTFEDIALPATRKAILRMAIVFGKGGVLVPYSWLARMGLGGKQGSGRQMFSWIHIDDVCGIIEWLWDHPGQQGTFNAAAPGPLPNHEFMRLMRQIHHMPLGIPAPAWLLEIAAFIHGTETELLLKSRWVMPMKLLREGCPFRYTDMKSALRNLLPL